jgi:hypothetical protein
MKLGAENRKKVILTATLMVIALAFFVYMVFGGSGSGTVPLGAADEQSQRRAHVQADASFDPSVRTDLLRDSEGMIYAGTGNNPFAMRSDPPPPPKCAPAGESSRGLPWCHEITIPGPPKAAEIPLTFFGFASKLGEPKTIFLSHDQDIFIAKEGDIVDRRYRIVHINPGSVEVQDVLDSNAEPQTIGLKT